MAGSVTPPGLREGEKGEELLMYSKSQFNPFCPILGVFEVLSFFIFLSYTQYPLFSSIGPTVGQTHYL